MQFDNILMFFQEIFVKIVFNITWITNTCNHPTANTSYVNIKFTMGF